MLLLYGQSNHSQRFGYRAVNSDTARYSRFSLPHKKAAYRAKKIEIFENFEFEWGEYG